MFAVLASFLLGHIFSLTTESLSALFESVFWFGAFIATLFWILISIFLRMLRDCLID
jgi:hypothetical protein